MARIKIANASIYYTQTNSQATTTTLFIHGSGGSHKAWPHQLRSLALSGVVLLDLPGHGLSTGSACHSVDAYATFIHDVIESLGLKRVFLAGHSLGGAIVLSLALAKPTWLAGLVLVGTGVRLRVHPDILEGIDQNYEQTVELICKWAFGTAAPSSLVSESQTAMLKTDSEVTRQDFIACNAFDVGSEVKTIEYPTLVLAASQDRLTPPKYGQFLNQHIKNSHYHLIEDAGHMMAVEKPKVFLNHLTRFLAPLV